MLAYKSDRLVWLDYKANTLKYKVHAVVRIPEPDVLELDFSFDVFCGQKVLISVTHLKNLWILQVDMVQYFEHFNSSLSRVFGIRCKELGCSGLHSGEHRRKDGNEDLGGIVFPVCPVLRGIVLDDEAACEEENSKHDDEEALCKSKEDANL